MIERVIVIGIDGGGSFHTPQLTPNIVSFLQSGSYCNLALAEFPSNSGENWGSILTGVTPSKHGVTNESILKPYSEGSDFPTIFKLIHKEFPSREMVSASLVSWTPINIGLIEPSLPVFKYEKEDSGLVEFITETFIPKYLPKTKYLFIQLSDLDYAGHTYGWGSPEFEAQYKKTDGQFKDILDAIEKIGLELSTLVVVTADHGGLHKCHGGSSFAEMHVLWGMRGPDVIQQEFEEGSVSSMDIPSTVLRALDIEVPTNFDGKVIPIF